MRNSDIKIETNGKIIKYYHLEFSKKLFGGAIYMKNILLILGVVFFNLIQGQASQNVQGEFIVRIQGPYNPQYAVASLSAQGLRVKEVLSRTLNMYLVQGPRSSQEGLGAAYRVKGIAYAQPNHYVMLRNSRANPIFRGLANDPEFGRQWNMLNGVQGGITATELWNAFTGGKDNGGNEIVVAVIDGGFDINHEDLRENIWVNRREIPGNGKDDDGKFVEFMGQWGYGCMGECVQRHILLHWGDVPGFADIIVDFE